VDIAISFISKVENISSGLKGLSIATTGVFQGEFSQDK